MFVRILSFPSRFMSLETSSPFFVQTDVGQLYKTVKTRTDFPTVPGSEPLKQSVIFSFFSPIFQRQDFKSKSWRCLKLFLAHITVHTHVLPILFCASGSRKTVCNCCCLLAS